MNLKIFINLVCFFILFSAQSFASVSAASITDTLQTKDSILKQKHSEENTIRIGVLAFRPKPIVKQRWQPLADFLTKKISTHKFEIIPYNYPELEEAVSNKTIDFVFTNSSHYVQIAFHTKLSSPLVTLINQKNAQVMEQFAGVIVTKKDNQSIKSLQDIKGKTIATPSLKSFGGFKMQAFELLPHKIFLPDDANIKETSMPHDRAIIAVRDGEADVAFVRSGILESMVQQNLITIQEFKVVNPQEQNDFPHLYSTRLYPEWPLAAMPHVNKDLSAKLVTALFSIPHDGNLAKK